MEKKYIDETRQGEAYAIADLDGNTKKLFLESYGCQMNFSDSEIVASIFTKKRLQYYYDFGGSRLDFT